MKTFTNLDAMWLATLADDKRIKLVLGDERLARLLRIAENIQGLDEKNQALASVTNDYAAGYAAAEAAMRRRSNVLQGNPEGEDERGRSILEQINRRVAQGNVKRIEQGVRALDDQPHVFNAPGRRTAKPKTVPAIDLDLDFLKDL